MWTDLDNQLVHTLEGATFKSGLLVGANFELVGRDGGLDWNLKVCSG